MEMGGDATAHVYASEHESGYQRRARRMTMPLCLSSVSVVSKLLKCVRKLAYCLQGIEPGKWAFAVFSVALCLEHCCSLFVGGCAC